MSREARRARRCAGDRRIVPEVERASAARLASRALDAGVPPAATLRAALFTWDTGSDNHYQSPVRDISQGRLSGGFGHRMTTTVQPRRLPANYQLVYDVVRAQEPGLHAPAGDIFARAKASKATLGYSTVYRALDRLCRMGLVLELHVPGMTAALYEQARSEHAHFVCRVCGRIEDVDCDLPANAINAAVRDRAGTVEEIILTVHGRCSACRGADDVSRLSGIEGPQTRHR